MARSIFLLLVVNRRETSPRPNGEEPIWSITAARMSTSPTAISCASGATSTNTKPVVMICIKSRPRKDPRIVPRPPERLAPPTITAAITRSSAPMPPLGSMALARLATITPASAAKHAGQARRRRS